MLDEVCGTTYPDNGINTTQRYMYIRMVTDDNLVTALGFQLQYKTIDIGEWRCTRVDVIMCT